MTTTTTTSVPLSAARSQQVFRAALDTLARPGTVRRLPLAGHGDDHADGLPAALLPLLALAELTTPACVLADADGPEWADVVRAMTSAPAAALPRARLVAALRPVTEDELVSLRTGSAAAPEDGALACLSVAGVRPVPDSGNPDGKAPGGGADDRLLRLSGPGIPGTRRLVITGLPSGFAAARRELTRDFPAGTDLLLITADGDITGLPRTTLIDEETD
jgi:alpha-D-ribose 1-methylphosphonate 5-triphosphate synthase subunit PhnH